MLFSSRRLTIIIVLLLLAGGLFFLYNLDNQFLSSADTNPWATTQPVERLSAPEPDFKPDQRYVLVGLPQNRAERAILTQIQSLLEQLHLAYRTRDQLKPNDYKLGETLIFVINDLERSCDLEGLAEFVQSGGSAILAAGMSPDYTQTYLDPLLGIQERGQFSTLDAIRIREATLPYPETEIRGLDPFMVVNLRVKDSATVLIESLDAMPLVWVHPTESGHIGVVNGPFLESPLTAGFLVPVLAETAGQFIYPVVNAEVIALDAAPPLFDSNDDLSFKYYGRSAESFVRDQLWNVFEQQAALLDLKYTTSFIGIDANPFNISQVNLQTFSFVNKQVLKLDGEIMLAGDHHGIGTLTADRVNQVAHFFQGALPNYAVRSYYPLYGLCEPQHLAAIRASFPEISIYRYLLDYYAAPEQQVALAQIAADPDLTLFPTVTHGFKGNRDQFLVYLSQLTTKGLVSHSFDINYLFTVPEQDSNWNELDEHYQDLCDQYFAPVRWLDSLTLSPAASRLQDTGKISFSSRYQNGELTVSCQDFVPGQSFLVYAPAGIKSTSGVTVTPVNRNYSLIIAQQPEFNLVIPDSGGASDA